MPCSALSSTGKGEQLLRMSLQSHGWWCGTDGARVTSRLFSGPCKQSRPMTCSIVPFEEEASSVTTKKNQGVPLLTIGSSSWLQRGVQLPFHLTAGLCLLLHKLQKRQRKKGTKTPKLRSTRYPNSIREVFGILLDTVDLWSEGFNLHLPSQGWCHNQAREANLRSKHTVIPSVVSFTMRFAPASEFCLTAERLPEEL
ncbi:uncharacterized protein LOC129134979 [Agelaius phoeniceus]|uniref:uncharacterized protein LOC129134979 n=1 Tax=Agelaius phoeniceus TaxID=39638 RepID=UPI004054A6FF